MAIRGAIRGLARNYADGAEALEIHVEKAESHGLPCKTGQRVPITLIIDGHSFAAGLRSTADCTYVWISPDVIGAAGQKTKLAYVLPNAGFAKNQQVNLQVAGRVVTVSPALP